MKRILLVAAIAAAPISPSFAQDAPTGAAARVEALEAGVAKSQYRLRVAQLYGRPPADIAGAGPAYERAQDSGGLVVRLDRAENQLRQMNGQIEQMQHQQRRLEEQLKKFQQDVEFRFQENAGKSRAPAPAPRERRGDIEPEVAPAITPAATTVATTTVATGSGLSSAPGIAVNPPLPGAGRRGDAFDPNPTAPRPLGATTASIPLSSTPHRASAPVDLGAAPGQPLDLSRGSVNGWTPPPVAATQPASIPAAPPQPGATSPGSAQVASVQQSGARLDYDIAMNHYRAGQYEAAEKAFGDFIGRNPKDRLASEAVFFLGESYFQRGRHREAAEQYLKISTSYGRSTKAAEAMLRLGQSLSALGAKEQACASFGELPRKYPNASANLRAAADREARRAACT
jgi:tol-pal system protein YbgF